MEKPKLHHFIVQAAIDANVYAKVPDHWLRDDTRDLLKYAKDRLIDLGVHHWPKVDVKLDRLTVTAEGAPEDDRAIRSIQSFLINLLQRILKEAQASNG
jgi:CRISPR/Cas system CSM-associated protein Csm2 small subunit